MARAGEPSASIVYTDQEHDALIDRLGAPPAPSAELRRTMRAPRTPLAT